MEPDDNRRLQDDEKVVIESTYGSDAKFELNAWKIWKPLSVCVHLKPLESASRIGQNATVFVDLSIVCSAEYPQVSPILSFKEHRGVSTEAMKIMMAELNEKAKTLLGSPMILELCEDVRTFLYDQKPLPTGSFHDTMLKKKAQDESEIKRQRANSEKRELEQVVEERERHNLEAQWRKEAEGERPEAVFESTDTEKVRLVGNRRYNFIEDARHRPRLSPYCTEWIGSIKDERFLVSEWSFKYTLGRQKAIGQITNFDEIVKKLSEIEQQIKRFKSMFGHDHTVIPCNYADVQRNSRSPSNFNVVIQLTQKLDDGDVCLSSILDNLHTDPNLVRRLAAHTVCALRWLHDQQASHGAISVNSIWTNDNSFRLSDALTLGALLSLAELFRQATAGVATSVGVQDEKSSRKKDLFALGTLLDTIARNNSPSNSCSAGSNEQLVDFIKACQSAKAIEELLDHPYLILDLPASGSSDNALGNRGDLNNRGRLVQEFFLMKWLGKGGFGDVILAKNKLDGNDYAIKRITLNPKSEKLNRRITREAKMFSRLNHPNVVRYYSAWIEDGSKQKDRTNTPASKKNESEVKLGQLSPDPAKGAGDSMLPTRLRNLDMAGGKCGSAHAETSEWSISYHHGGRNTADSSSSDDESDAPARTLFSPKDSNDEYEIVFKSDSKETNSSPVSSGVTTSEIEDPTTDVTQSSQGAPTATDPTKPTTTTVTTTQDTNDITIPSRMLFIQMEYCERSTLRAYIDNKSLFGHTRPIWRMFREILSGLSYIHSKAMIHRDIKPMNILLDSNEHVKIGDFGLATPDLIKKESVIVTMDPKFSGQTRDIGTELYMAPELFKVDDVVPYTSKIDIYSTGVVLFEMFYRPLPPGMERISTIRTLKTTTATVRPDDLGIGYFPMPDDFGTEYSPVQARLARKLVVWMLQEDANSRPTVEELLAYDELPIVDIEDQTFQSDFLITVKKRSGQLYNWMLDTMFKQEPSAAHNYCFDQDICKSKYSTGRDLEIERVQSIMRQVLHAHCFIPVNSQFLIPAPPAINYTGRFVKPYVLMDGAGYLTSLPTDLRQNFVRYCCRNSVNRMKRYTFDRVFSCKDGMGRVHPNERWESCVDSIGPVSSALTLTSELLITVGELISAALSKWKCTIRIGHVGLIESIMRHLTIHEESWPNVMQCLHEISTSEKPISHAERVEMLGAFIGERKSNSLFSFLTCESSVALMKENCRMLYRSRDESVRDTSREALNQLDRISEVLNAAFEESSSRIQIVYDLSLAYRPTTFKDGLVFLMSTEVPLKKYTKHVTLLGGGRYDSLLERERHAHDEPPPTPLCLIGCSISLERMANLRKSDPSGEYMSCHCSAVVCSFSSELVLEKFRLCQSLWRLDIATDIFHEPVTSLDNLIAHCETNGIEHILVVFSRDEVLLRSNRIDHGKMDFGTALATVTWDYDDEATSFVTTPNSSAVRTTSVTPSVTASHSNCVIDFAIPDRVPFNTKKRIENQVKAVLHDFLSLFASKGKICVVITELSVDLLKTIAGSLTRTISIDELNRYFDGLARNHGKSKRDIDCLLEVLQQIRSPRNVTAPVIILFRHLDGFYRTVT